MSEKNETSKTERVLFGGGCFWCTEAVFKMLRGIVSVAPGYAGGTTKNPTYEEVSSGDTGHAEVIEVVYDPSVIEFRDLLAVFFGSHDPTTLNQQGGDIGTQYRSAIFCETAGQKAVVTSFIADINASSVDGNPIVTEVADMPEFYSAESYHVDFYARNKGNQYCEVIINPKLQKAQEHFARLLKDNV